MLTASHLPLRGWASADQLHELSRANLRTVPLRPALLNARSVSLIDGWLVPVTFEFLGHQAGQLPGCSTGRLDAPRPGSVGGGVRPPNAENTPSNLGEERITCAVVAFTIRGWMPIGIAGMVVDLDGNARVEDDDVRLDDADEVSAWRDHNPKAGIGRDT